MLLTKHLYLLFIHTTGMAHFRTTYSLPQKVKMLCMKAHRGNSSIAPFVLKLGARWGWVSKFTCQPLCPRCLLDRRTRVPQGRSERFCRRDNILSQPGFEPRIIQPVASHYTDYAVIYRMKSRSVTSLWRMLIVNIQKCFVSNFGYVYALYS